jgi:hypothetical protein
MPRCNISRSMRRMRTAKARRPVGQCCQSPSASPALFLRGVWRMVQLSSNVHRATRKPSSLQRAMRNMQLT